MATLVEETLCLSLGCGALGLGSSVVRDRSSRTDSLVAVPPPQGQWFVTRALVEQGQWFVTALVEPTRWLQYLLYKISGS